MGYLGDPRPVHLAGPQVGSAAQSGCSGLLERVLRPGGCICRWVVCVAEQGGSTLFGTYLLGYLARPQPAWA